MVSSMGHTFFTFGESSTCFDTLGAAERKKWAESRIFSSIFLPKCWLSYRTAAFECHNTQRSSSSFMTRAKKPAAIGETSPPITNVQKRVAKNIQRGGISGGLNLRPLTSRATIAHNKS